jgi:flagellin
MRINTNVSSINAQRLLTNTNLDLRNSMGKLSSGFRITRAADDAAGLAIANKFSADLRSMGAASRNISEANSMLEVAEGAVSTIQDILVRMKELATQASSTNSGTQLTVLDSEFQALGAEIDRIANSTNYQGQALLTGTFALKRFQIGSSTTANDVLNVTVSISTTGVGLTTAAAGLNLATMVLTSVFGATSTMERVDTALDKVNSLLGGLGAYQNRLDYAQKNLQTSIQNYEASQSVIRDVDMAKEMANLSKLQILQQAGTAMLAQANQSNQSVLQLLQ